MNVERLEFLIANEEPLVHEAAGPKKLQTAQNMLLRWWGL